MVRSVIRKRKNESEIILSGPDNPMGHAITHSRPLAFRRTPLLKKFDAYRVNGTPADCVALGTFLWKQVDVVLSGINLGPNIGNGIWHSGTLAAARCAAATSRLARLAAKAAIERAARPARRFRR